MEYLRGSKQYAAMMDGQFKKLLETMMEELNPVKPASTFETTPGQASIEKLIEQSKAKGIKLWQ